MSRKSLLEIFNQNIKLNDLQAADVILKDMIAEDYPQVLINTCMTKINKILGTNNYVYTLTESTKNAIEREIKKSQLFSIQYLRATYKHLINLTDSEIVLHFIDNSGIELLNPSPYFDTKYYLQSAKNHKLHVQGNCALYDYLERCKQINESNIKSLPNSSMFFSDSVFYEEIKHLETEQLKKKSLLEIFLSSNQYNKSSAIKNFSPELYIAENPDTAFVNVLKHYLDTLKIENRLTMHKANGRPIGALHIAKHCDFKNIKETDIVIISIFSQSQQFSSLQEETIKQYKKNNFKVCVVVNHTDLHECIANKSFINTDADSIILRENIGFDFGSWQALCWLYPSIVRARSLVLTNDSLCILDLSNFKILLGKVRDNKDEILFLTDSKQISYHFQTFFIAIGQNIIPQFIEQYLLEQPLCSSKMECIENIELNTYKTLKSLNFKSKALFSLLNKKDFDESENSTIKYWKQLADEGFPFIKITLFTEGKKNLSEDEFSIIPEDCKKSIEDHLKLRKFQSIYNKRVYEPGNHNVLALYTSADQKPFNKYQARNAWNPGDCAWPVVKLQENTKKYAKKQSVICILHCFYTDIADKIISSLLNNPSIDHIICTTDSKEKAGLLSKFSLSDNLEVRVCPNRGRDVAPLLIDCAKTIQEYEILLHLHTKKSPHDSIYGGWLDWLLNNLLPNNYQTQNILDLLANNKNVGLVYSEHFSPVKNLRNWGFDYEMANNLLRRMNISISPENLLEFPTSTMFWAKVDAIRPLLELNLSRSDFDEEKGQIDGTLAHAIERCFCFVAEKQGYLAIPVTTSASPCSIPSSLDFYKYSYKYASLNANSLMSKNSELLFSKSLSNRPRLNLLLPTLNQEKVFGGITTAIKVFKDLYAAMNSEAFDLRIIVIDENTKYTSLQSAIEKYFNNFIYINSHDSDEYNQIVDLKAFQHQILPIRENDIFFATAWWTAIFARNLQDAQKAMFGNFNKYIYLIQDYEPGFYNWSDNKVRAESSYFARSSYVPIVNSEELYAYMVKKYQLEAAFCLPFRINQILKDCIKTKSIKRNQILVYARPSTERNLFGTIVESLELFQQSHPSLSNEFQIIFVGEKFDNSLCHKLFNYKILGKLSLEEYSELLSTSKLGLSLMMSPHPSYPPLEMAYAGCKVITNSYENKDLSLRSPNIISIDDITPLHISRALYQACTTPAYHVKQDSASIVDLDLPPGGKGYFNASVFLKQQYPCIFSV